MMLDRWRPVIGNHWNMSNKPTLWKHAVQVDLSVDVIFSPKPLTNMFFARRNCWLKMMPRAREAPSDTSTSLQWMSQCWHVTSSYILLTCIFAGSDWIDLGRGNIVGASQTRSASRESRRWRDEGAAGRIHRKQELGDGVGWLLMQIAWRLSGGADVALRTTVLTCRRPLSNILFSVFLFFPLHDKTEGSVISRERFSCGKRQPKLCWGWCSNHWGKCWGDF